MDTIRYDWKRTDAHPLTVYFSQPRPGLEYHLPEDMHEAVHIGIVLKGDREFLLNGVPLVIEEGEMYLTAPWEPHRSLRSRTGNKLLLLSADPEAVNRAVLSGADRLNLLYRTPPAERQQILSRLRPPERAVRRICELFPQPDSPERELRLWHAALEIFVEIATQDFSTAPDPDYPRLLPALRRLGRKPLTVSEAGSACSLSESRFAHLFRRVFGMSFARYERLYRLRGAVGEMEQRHCSRKEAAERWGFFDASHLAKVRAKCRFPKS